jgi:AcrR family transcriptional regulator
VKRPYKLGQRQVAADQTRANILSAARNLLSAEGGIAGFTMEGVAREATVSRMTVYYQFESKTKLLEALCDDLAVRGGMDRMGAVFARPEPLDALEAFVGQFARFWGSDRRLVRRLHGMAALDPEIDAVIRAREGRRREGLRVIVGRISERHGRPAAGDFDEVVETLWAIISFEMFSALAGPDRTFEQVAPRIAALARSALGRD